MCLFVSEPLIRERGLVTDDELLATAITSEGAHFLEVRRSALSLFYRYRSHLSTFIDRPVLRSFAARVRALAAARDALMAIARRSSAVRFSALALPPILPRMVRAREVIRCLAFFVKYFRGRLLDLRVAMPISYTMR